MFKKLLAFLLQCIFSVVLLRQFVEIQSVCSYLGAEDSVFFKELKGVLDTVKQNLYKS